ncbi:MAG: hypothetical protein Q9163_001345 [Psora crenata]
MHEPRSSLPETFFFSTLETHFSLPSPRQVRHLSGDPGPQPEPVKLEELGLVVEFGPHVTIQEALSQRFIRDLLHPDVDVPEVYGWRIDEAQVFIYMEFIRGDPLKDRWQTLDNDERLAVCGQLRRITNCSINRGPLQDYVFEGKPQGGPFATVCQFNDWFSQLPQQRAACLRPVSGPLPDDATIKLIHGDLHGANILIAPHGPPLVLAIINWGQAGWYPEYWEYCKAAYTSLVESEWRDRWIPEFLVTYLEEHETFCNILHRNGLGLR